MQPSPSKQNPGQTYLFTSLLLQFEQLSKVIITHYKENCHFRRCHL